MNDFQKQVHTDKVVVYLAPLPSKLPSKLDNLFPPLRNDVILSCKNDKSKREKYFVWKLLERCFFDVFNKKMENLCFSRSKNGKWLCTENYYFSLSHSNSILAVAVSLYPVGVDILHLTHQFSHTLENRLLCQNEKNILNSLPFSQKNEFLASVWAKKEAQFKKIDGEKTLFSVDTTTCSFFCDDLLFSSERYFLRVATDYPESVSVLFLDEF